VDCFDDFDPLTGDVPGFPFFELWGVASEARILLAGASGDDIRMIERHLDNLIWDTKNEFARVSLDDHVARVIEQGSWELQYLPAGTAPTQQSVRDLLEDWPETADVPDYLTEDDLSDVEALRMATYTGALGAAATSEHSYPVHCAAVLALMKVAACLDTLKCPEEDLGTHEDGPVAARLVSAANDAIDAALALGFARELAAEAVTRAEAAEDLAESIEERQRRFNEERARKAAMARHGHLKPAIQFVRTEWEEHREAYDFNKTDFARTYVELVRNKFRDRRGDPVKVTIKTITEVWLAPSASKPAGEPAAGE
jgi:hypothetical protein